MIYLEDPETARDSGDKTYSICNANSGRSFQPRNSCTANYIEIMLDDHGQRGRCLEKIKFNRYYITRLKKLLKVKLPYLLLEHMSRNIYGKKVQVDFGELRENPFL